MYLCWLGRRLVSGLAGTVGLSLVPQSPAKPLVGLLPGATVAGFAGWGA